MSNNKRDQSNEQSTSSGEAQAAEFDDGTGIDAGGDWGADDAFNVVGGDPNYHYFLAADDGDKDRPDGVHQLLQRGYQRCTEEKCIGGGGCVLLRTSRKAFESRRAAKQKAADALLKATQETAQKAIPEDVLRDVARR